MNHDIPQIAFQPQEWIRSPIEVVDLRNLVERKGDLDHDPEQPHRVGFNILLFIEQGHGTHFLDFKHHEFGPGTVICIQQHQVHAFALSAQLVGKMVLFPRDFIEQVHSHIRVPLFGAATLQRDYCPLISLTPSTVKRCFTLINEIETETRATNSSDIIIHHLFAALLHMTFRQSDATDNPNQYTHHSDRLVRFSRLIESQYFRTRNASDYAEQLHITYKTLNQLCRKELGLSAKQVIDNYVLLEAKRRLSIEDNPIQRIAEELGFDEVTNFVKFFKKHQGDTPSQFRKY